MRRVGTGLVGIVAVSVACALSAAPALASTVTLYAAAHGSGSTCSSSDPCSLQSALDADDSASDTYVINVAAGTYAAHDGYTIGVGGLAESLTLTGAGVGNTILTGGFMSSEPQEGGTVTLDEAASYPVTIEDMTVENGYGEPAAIAADVEDSSPDQLTLDDDVIDGGDSQGGQGLVGTLQGPLEIENSTVENAYGPTDTEGATAESASASLTIEDSTFNDDPFGDVLIEAGAEGSMIDSTFVGATSGGDGAIANGGTGQLLILDSTFSDDADALAALGTGNGGSAVAIEFGDDILAGTKNCPDEGGTYTDLGENVETDSSCPTTGGDDKQSVSSAALALGSLADNGGPTETEKITTTSVAHDLAPTGGLINFACGGNDQRGIPREQVGASKCDVGAYAIAPPTLNSAAPTGAESGASVTLTGTNLSDVTSVKFGSASAAVSAQSQTSLTVRIPSVPEGSAPITATNPDGVATLAYSISGPLISTRSLTPGKVGSPYSQKLSATGGVAPLTWKLVSGKLPGGLTLSSAGAISGKPTGTGTFKFSVSVADARGESATSSLSLTVPPGVVGIKSSKLSVKKSRIGVSLSCGSDPCAGTIKLTSSKGKELANVSYSLAAGSDKTFELKLTKAGKKAFKHASKHKPVKAKLSVSVAGGATASKSLKVG